MARRDMKAKRSAIIDHLQQLRQVLSSVSTPNFEIDELRELGLKAVRVELARDKEASEFEPCFFLPQPPSMLEYPFIQGEEIYDLDIQPKRTYEETLARVIKMYPLVKDQEELASKEYLWKSEFSSLDWHIFCQWANKRSGIYTSDGPASLHELSPLRYGWDLFPDAEGSVSLDPGDRIGDGSWYTWEAYLDDSISEDKSAAMPHAMIGLNVHYRGNDTSLTHAGVCGLLHHMYHWYSLEFEQYAMGPVSLRLFFTDTGIL